MAETIREVMTPDPVCLEPNATLTDAARAMSNRDIGTVLIANGGGVTGIVTDRDIVVRGIAAGCDPAKTDVREVCTESPHTLSSDEPIEHAIKLVREDAIRRIPVVDEGRPVGIVSLGDLAIERDKNSALGEISRAAPNN